MSGVKSSGLISLQDPAVLVASVTSEQIKKAGTKSAAVHQMLHPLEVEVVTPTCKEGRLRVVGHMIEWARRSGTVVEIVDRRELVAKVEGTPRHLVVVRVKGGCSDGQ